MKKNNELKKHFLYFIFTLIVVYHIIAFIESINAPINFYNKDLFFIIIIMNIIYFIIYFITLYIKTKFTKISTYLFVHYLLLITIQLILFLIIKRMINIGNVMVFGMILFSSFIYYLVMPIYIYLNRKDKK
jgi:hypothetical protein